MADIGFIGSGEMGSGLVRGMLRAGKSVAVVAHRRRDLVDELVADGAAEAPSVAALADTCPVIMTCVTDADATMEVAASVLPRLDDQHMWIDVTTSDPQASQALAVRVEERGGIFADAPVSGGPDDAARRQVRSLVGCRREKFNRVKAVVETYSRVVQRFGDAGAGNTAKLVNTFVTQTTSLLVVEAFDRARRAGIDWRALYDIMSAGTARSAVLERIIEPALEDNFDGHPYTVSKAQRDIVCYQQLSSNMDGQASMLAEAVGQLFDAAIRSGNGQLPVSQLLNADAVAGKKAI